MEHCWKKTAPEDKNKEFLTNKEANDHFRENMGQFVDKGVIVLSNYKNDATSTDANLSDLIKIRENNKGSYTQVEIINKWHTIQGWIHTHPEPGIENDQGGLRMPSDDDFKTSEKRFPGKPAYVMSRLETFSFSGVNNTFKSIGKTSDVLSGKLKLMYIKR